MYEDAGAYFRQAWGALKVGLKLQPSDTLLIRGGPTSVGLASAALAKSSLFNARTVIATTRSASKTQSLEAAGVDHVVVDTANSASAAVKALTGGKGADKCIELVGGPTLMDSFGSLQGNGTLAYVGCVSGEWTCKEFDPGMALHPHKVLKHLNIYFVPHILISY